MTKVLNERFMITKDHPGSLISESYKTLRTNIRFSTLDRLTKVLLVTSAGPSEGRTTTTTNLAITYAQENKKVLLIDGDLRKPTINKVFYRANRHGLSEVLNERCTVEDSINETDQDNLWIMTSGAIPPNPSELLGSERMRSLLLHLSEQFDVILIDSPPALAVADAQILGAMCDGVVLVVHYGKVTVEAVRKVRRNMEHVNARILGVVLNNSNRSKAESYYRSYYGGE